jgi:hypothetical protein
MDKDFDDKFTDAMLTFSLLCIIVGCTGIDIAMYKHFLG